MIYIESPEDLFLFGYNLILDLVVGRFREDLSLHQLILPRIWTALDDLSRVGVADAAPPPLLEEERGRDLLYLLRLQLAGSKRKGMRTDVYSPTDGLETSEAHPFAKRARYSSELLIGTGRTVRNEDCVRLHLGPSEIRHRASTFGDYATGRRSACSISKQGDFVGSAKATCIDPVGVCGSLRVSIDHQVCGLTGSAYCDGRPCGSCACAIAISRRGDRIIARFETSNICKPGAVALGVIDKSFRRESRKNIPHMYIAGSSDGATNDNAGAGREITRARSRIFNSDGHGRASTRIIVRTSRKQKTPKKCHTDPQTCTAVFGNGHSPSRLVQAATS